MLNAKQLKHLCEVARSSSLLEHSRELLEIVEKIEAQVARVEAGEVPEDAPGMSELIRALNRASKDAGQLVQGLLNAKEGERRTVQQIANELRFAIEKCGRSAAERDAAINTANSVLKIDWLHLSRKEPQ